MKRRHEPREALVNKPNPAQVMREAIGTPGFSAIDHDENVSEPGRCYDCEATWPCDTRQAVDRLRSALSELEAERDRLKQDRCLICEHPADHDQRLCVTRLERAEAERDRLREALVKAYARIDELGVLAAPALNEQPRRHTGETWREFNEQAARDFDRVRSQPSNEQGPRYTGQATSTSPRYSGASQTLQWPGPHPQNRQPPNEQETP